jgi:hypothetical protein
VINPYNPASQRPAFNSLAEANAWHNARRAQLTSQRALERNQDPAWLEKRRARQEIYDKQKAEEVAKEAEAAKHARVGCPPGFNAHVDRDYHTKLSFLPYLERALREYEDDYPDQRPAPIVDVHQEGIDRRNAESRTRARALETCTSRSDLERLLAVRPADIGQEEAVARKAARDKLRLMAADPHGGESAVEAQDAPAPAPALETTDPEPVKRGRGRPPKFLQRVEVTEDGAILED